MRSKIFKSVLIKSGLAASVLLLASGAAFGQTVTAAAIGRGTVDVGASATTAALTLTADSPSHRRGLSVQRYGCQRRPSRWWMRTAAPLAAPLGGHLLHDERDVQPDDDGHVDRLHFTVSGTSTSGT